MTKTFTYLNFTLVLILAAVCTYQWSREKDYGSRLSDLQRTADNQEQKILVQTDDIRRANEDIDGFKKSVTDLKSQTDEQVAQIREQKAQLFSLNAEKSSLSTQLKNWQNALEEHKAALAARDGNIKTLLSQRDQILKANKDAADKANQAIVAYNDLATKYDDLVKRYNDLATQYKAEHENAESASSKGEKTPR